MFLYKNEQKLTLFNINEWFKAVIFVFYLHLKDYINKIRNYSGRYFHTALHHHVDGDVKSLLKYLGYQNSESLFFVELRQPL